MAPEVEPAGLAQLLDFAERPHAANWGLRAALVRYAQPQPQRVEDLLALVRRIHAAFREQSTALQSDGPRLWAALETMGESVLRSIPAFYVRNRRRIQSRYRA